MGPDAQLILTQARRLVPPCVALAWRDPRQTYPVLGAEEELIAKAVPKRRAEFSAGRDAARECLRALGSMQKPILAKSRAPIWPKTIAGSITHSDQHCVAALAKSTDLQSIGIDLEMNRTFSEDISRTILTPAELPETPGLLLRSFAAKEAVYKAVSHRARRVMSFHEIALEWEESDATAVFCNDVGDWSAGTRLPVKTAYAAGHWLAVCTIGTEVDPC